MNQTEFLNTLSARLHKLNVADAEEILEEYEAHFAFKLADGYGEEEVAARLGDPENLARQFAADTGAAAPKQGGGALLKLGLGCADVFVCLFFVLLWAWVLVLAVFAVTLAAVGVCLGLGLSGFGLIPSMPVGCALIFMLTFLAGAVLAAVGTVYCGLYTRQLMRCWFRWQKNTLAAAAGTAVYPPLSASPRLAPKYRRRLRKTALGALTVFAVSFLAAYTVCAIAAGDLQFWHVWNWFVA